MQTLSIKLFTFLIAGAAILTALFFLVRQNLTPQQKQSDNRLSVVTTLYPLYDFTREVGKDLVRVTLLLPPGTEPHAFEPKPADIVTINQTDVFIYTGKFMEVWAEDLLDGIPNKTLKIIDASSGITLFPAGSHDEDKQVGSNDPHIWLDFGNAQAMVNTIAAGLAQKDPANKAVYLANAASFSERLHQLDEEYKRVLATCKTRKIVYGGHYAFGYLAKRFGLTYVAAQGISPNAEPTAHDLATLVEQIKVDAITSVFYEELTSPKIAETLAKETGTRMLSLNAAHNVTKQDLEAGVTFVSVMEENLAHLTTGLACR
ncbi:zinc ABC transporter substrate-binding protein [Patescibacteria group bacterium]|nr:zinc ABC transporter substrate-binding protein [Patescibacteria group bacterium]MBU1472488.1 zinc ABC transporter substrate-binding protein [Patescibacteria group bacterium]MBU2460302.1 zinc ABC transporter substrate-binding protein [Patescibacteria group bacterium]MBU2543840.1 zinc ABC transporter substrate-binding protein [Patescibacteria group bacterium]